MRVFPSIDVSEGRAVKRVRGVKGTGLDLGDPVKWAEFWALEGAKGLHVVDLDGAEAGKPINVEVINKVIEKAKEYGLWVQVAGGLREVEHLERYPKADAFVIGSRAHKDPEFLEVASEAVGADKVIVAIDLKGGKVSVEGWKEEIPVGLKEALEKFKGRSFRGFLYTYVDTEGTMEGPDVSGVKYIRREYPDKLLEYAGGVGSPEHVKLLESAGADVVVLGMALYSGKLRLKDLV
ncbi:HisA/HisF-related TIM barrel protein [Ignicoccus hospitalis]|uniref:1-(5-phosphoribosyl)-5-[(5-phosphoribosylamino)methylideneamino] imidazole-4-carboxamide isomerase n=1 Tax=Ignicoccus hospitalis (strain KIN4/I / DSM 18386 / JCM 14125) TaxID=453591 RepID=A8A8V9_IGNH4|nr:1-(5-phosphoribosyl)-5-[(5-phosphoribosylamino)methylideneamino] imidazole-4-carboxamide isomerase [Ignicoccus hospitalis]ABU81361.1 1-(5-phosphoribosyl)-5-((5-phosphoribosylamino)methylideneamino) imidazole-4-carboxamide isomerase [Ignicoccus hospitalis KIN4/I]HIH90335.1 1-(5-phosphoribosyl)-5-[(5-phosphoribosylamino)methylideneamino] imidazole-4-carboxamide isomerase [Desulfurococcaceae archaeon]